MRRRRRTRRLIRSPPIFRDPKLYGVQKFAMMNRKWARKTTIHPTGSVAVIFVALDDDEIFAETKKKGLEKSE
jgi:hypothetical protein